MIDTRLLIAHVRYITAGSRKQLQHSSLDCSPFVDRLRGLHSFVSLQLASHH